MKEYKVYVKDSKTSAKVQKHAFSLGWVWKGGKEGICRLDDPFLYFGKDLEISYSNIVEGLSYFKDKINTELDVNEFLNLTKDDIEAIQIFELSDSEIMTKVWVGEGRVFKIPMYDTVQDPPISIPCTKGVNWISKDELFKNFKYYDSFEEAMEDE